MDDLDLHSIRIVRAIAEHGTISAAAAALGYSQPAVSQHLKRAEARLGLPLTTRVGRGIRLTEAGTVLARHAISIQSALDAAHGDLADLAGLATGTVRIAGFPTASSTLMPRVLSAARRQFPGFVVTYTEAEPPEAIGMLRDGTADIAITFAYPGDRSDPHHDADLELTSVPLFTEPMVLVLPRTDPLASTDSVHLAGLDNAEWIAGCPLCRGHLLAICESVGVSPSIAIETDNAVAVLGLVANGLGVALLPQLALATALVPAGVAVRAPAPASARTINAVIQPGSQRVPSIAAVLSLITRIDGAEWGLTRS